MYAYLRSFLFLAAFPAIAWAGSGSCHTEVTFLGFSSNELAFAEQVDVSCHPRPGITDHFKLARVFDAKTGHEQGVFRVTAPARTAQDGHLVSVSSATFAANYPLFRNAMRQQAWQKVSHAAGFHHVRHRFENDAVRFRAINDSIANIHVHNGVVTISGHDHLPLAFVVTARTKDGEQFDIASLHGSAGDSVRLEFFFAPSGRAVVVHALKKNGSSQWLTPGAALPGPIDSPDIGALNVMQWESKAALRDYGSIGDGKHSDEVDAYIEDAFRL